MPHVCTFTRAGHRYDSMVFANGMIASGMSCQLFLI